MNISNNLSTMHIQEMKMNSLAKSIAETANFIEDPELQEISQSLIDSITQQIPTQIAYEVQGSAIKTQDEIFASTINIKA